MYALGIKSRDNDNAVSVYPIFKRCRNANFHRSALKWHADPLIYSVRWKDALGGQDASLRMGRPFKDPGDRSKSIMEATVHAGIFITAASPAGSTLPRHRSQIASVTQEPVDMGYIAPYCLHQHY